MNEDKNHSIEPLIENKNKNNNNNENEDNEENEIILLQNNNIKYKNNEINLKLTKTKLIIESSSSSSSASRTLIYNLNSLIGLEIITNKKNNNEKLKLYFYLFSNSNCLNCFSKNRKRKEVIIELFFDNIQLCQNWYNSIHCVLKNVPIIRIINENNCEIIQPPPIVKYLVFVNPVGGTGNAVNIWNRVRPFLDYALIEYELLITERANHAKDTMATRRLDDITAVVIVGGDGLIFEVVSGLMSRSDAQTQLSRLIFAPIPGGSGNGLIKSILHESNEEYSPENAMFVAIRGKSTPLDLSQV